MPMNIRALSQLLLDLKENFHGQDRLSVGELMDSFHERGFGFFLFLIALPAALPLPALGINTIIALPLLLLTGQQMLGFHTIWLPERIRRKQMEKKTLHKVIDMGLPWTGRLEKLIKPRLAFMTQGIFSNLIGLVGFILSLAVTLPVPLTHTVPCMGIVLMAIGVLMRDGLAVIGGIVLGLGWVTMLGILFFIFGTEGIHLLHEYIGNLF